MNPKSISFPVQVVSDLHGVFHWSSLIDWDFTRVKQIIFLGDYVDPYDGFNLSGIDVQINLEELLAFKNMYPEQVILLLGNHDVFYLSPRIARSNLYGSYAKILQQLFRDNIHLFQLSHQIGNCLFSHAGLTRQFWKFLGGKGTNYAFTLNKMFADSRGNFDMEYYWRRCEANLPYGNIITLSRSEFKNKNNWITGLHQIVGHHAVDEIETDRWYKDDECISSIIYTNTLRSRGLQVFEFDAAGVL